MNNREYIEYKNKLYWTEKQNTPSKVVNGVIKPLGIAAPTEALTSVLNATGSIAVTATAVQYTYTYYDSGEGIESAPAPLSTELTLPTGKSVDLSGFVASTNIFVDKIRLYRVGADATDFTLLIELPVATTTYNDNIPTLSAIGTILTTYTYQTPLSNLRYITEAYGMLFAAIGTSLYYTEIGGPDYWPATNFIPIAETITGIAAIPDGLVIFTYNKAYLLLGTD
jgi:hypothetical protein